MTHLDRPPLLVVDDSDDDRYFLRRAHRLAELSVPLVCLPGGHEMLAYHADVQRSERTRPLAILLDINMPGLDGFAAYERLITDFRDLDGVPVWFLTGSDDPLDTDRAKALGAQGLLTKPPSVKALARLLARVVAVAGGSPA